MRRGHNDVRWGAGLQKHTTCTHSPWCGENGELLDVAWCCWCLLAGNQITMTMIMLDSCCQVWLFDLENLGEISYFVLLQIQIDISSLGHSRTLEGQWPHVTSSLIWNHWISLGCLGLPGPSWSQNYRRSGAYWQEKGALWCAVCCFFKCIFTCYALCRVAILFHAMRLGPTKSSQYVC